MGGGEGAGLSPAVVQKHRQPFCVKRREREREREKRGEEDESVVKCFMGNQRRRLTRRYKRWLWLLEGAGEANGMWHGGGAKDPQKLGI